MGTGCWCAMVSIWGSWRQVGAGWNPRSWSQNNGEEAAMKRFSFMILWAVLSGGAWAADDGGTGGPFGLALDPRSAALGGATIASGSGPFSLNPAGLARLDRSMFWAGHGFSPLREGTGFLDG